MEQSSVAFNLAELMRLEAQRNEQERQEQAADRVGLEQGGQEPQRRVAPSAQGRRKAESPQPSAAYGHDARGAAEPDTRLRLGLEATQQARTVQAPHELLPKLDRPVAEPPRRSVSLALALGALACAAVVGGLGLYVGVLRPRLESSRAVALAAQQLADERGQAIDALRRALAQSAEVSAPAAAATNVASSEASAPGQPAPHRATPERALRRAPPATRTAPRPHTARAGTDELDELDLVSDDPLKGLP